MDLPGHGLSSHFPSGMYFSVMDCVFTLRRVVDHLGWNQFILIAHSFGSHIAIYFAALFGDSISRIVLIDIFIAFLIREGDFAAERCLLIFNKLLKGVNKTYPPTTYTRCLKKLCDEGLFKIGVNSARALQTRAFTETQEGFVPNNDSRLKLLMYPLISTNFHNQLIKNVRCYILLISTSDFEQFSSLH